MCPADPRGMDAIPSDVQTHKAAPKGPNSAFPLQKVLLWLGQLSLQFSFPSDFGTTCANTLQLHMEPKPELLLKASLGEQMDPFPPFRTSPQSSRASAMRQLMAQPKGKPCLICCGQTKLPSKAQQGNIRHKTTHPYEPKSAPKTTKELTGTMQLSPNHDGSWGHLLCSAKGKEGCSIPGIYLSPPRSRR